MVRKTYSFSSSSLDIFRVGGFVSWFAFDDTL